MTFGRFTVVVIGGGPAGIAAAVAASGDGASVMLVEHEKRLGGKMNQSIQDAFGFIRFSEGLAGPEYIYREITLLDQTNTVVLVQTTVINIVRIDNAFQLTMSNRHGISVIECNAIVLAAGCREQTLSEIGIHGTQPSGVFSAGTAQYILNVMGQLPVRSCIMLGSNNLSLATARALSLSGVKIIGVYEPGSTPKGYLDNVSRCLFDFLTPLHLEHTITRVFGTERIRGVELARADHNGNPIRGSEKAVLCDGFIASGELLPDNSLALSLGVPLSARTKGPLCDHNRMTLKDGVFACGGSLYVSDLVDYDSENGELAGRNAARYMPHTRKLVEINASNDFLTFVPHYVDFDLLFDNTVIYFNPAAVYLNAKVYVMVDGTDVIGQEFDALRPNETQRIDVNLTNVLTPESKIVLRMDY